jgi:hypothetical protein
MRIRIAMKWVVFIPLVLLLAVASTGMADEPQAAQPSAIACGDSAFCAMAGSALYVRNNGGGASIYGENISGLNSSYGVRGRGNPGVYGTSWLSAGVRGVSVSGRGVKGESTNSDGVYGFSANDDGVYGESTNDTGVQGYGPTGVYGLSAAYNGEGVHGHGANVYTEGVLGTAAYAIGVYGISSGSTGLAYGVWGQTNGTYGLYTDQDLYVGGICVGCAMAFVGQNADAGELLSGDVVSISGVASPLKGQDTPVLEVQRATGTGGGALGVVQARAEVTAVERRIASDDFTQRESVETTNLAPGPVAPGDHLFIVVQGIVQVRADAAAGIQAGDRLMAGSDGLAVLAAPDAQTIGRAVDAVDPATSLVWVLLDLQ